jgi:hypothetical protein
MSPLWRDAVERRKTFYTLHNVRQEHCKQQIDSGQQVSSLPDIALEVVAVRLQKICAFSIICYSGLAVDQIKPTGFSFDTVHYFT